MAVEALIVQTRRRGPGQLAGLSDAGDGSFFTNLIDNVTGGQLSSAQAQLDRLETLLTWSILASFVSAGIALASLFRKGGR